MKYSQENKGTKYRAIVFFPAESTFSPMKFENWINDYTIERKQFQRFIKNKYPAAVYANLYNKDTGFYSHRLTF